MEHRCRVRPGAGRFVDLHPGEGSRTHGWGYQGQTRTEKTKHLPARCKKEMSIKGEKSGISNGIMRV